VRGTSSSHVGLLAVALAGVLGLWSAAQYFAWRLDYHPNLGDASFLWSGVPIYSPVRYLIWVPAYRSVPALSDALKESLVVAGAGVVVTLACMAGALRSRSTAVTDSHGSARWGNARSLLSDADGLIVGQDGARLLRYAARGEPLLTFAPTGAGKGVSVAIPNLLDYPGSVLATDPKGELAAVTARRRQEMGQRVHVLDPWHLAGGQAAYNPLDLIDLDGDDAVDDARLLASMLVTDRGGEEAGYWNAEAVEVLTALTLHVTSSLIPEHRNLPYIRQLLTLPGAEFEELLAEMRENEAADGLVARTAASLQDRAVRSPKEYLGVLSTARSHTHFLASRRMERVLRTSTFEPTDLKRGRTSVYLVLPAERLDGYGAWMRLVIASTLSCLSRARGTPEPPALLLLDEVGQLGRMQPVARAASLGRGYGVQLWLLFQSLYQLEASYGLEGRAILANAGLIQAFGVADPDTSEYFSRLTGECTISIRSNNESRGISGQGALLTSRVQSGRSVTISDQGRRLLTPDEVRRLSRDEQLLFVRGEDPIRCERPDYRTLREFGGRFEMNPMHQGVSRLGS
jgi:type IV secretion system protein VirD4